MSSDERYSRQVILPEIGARGQERLARARVLVIGAGGLGCPALLYLAGAGVGAIGIVDFDRVAVSNLQRQVLFVSGDEGRLKAEAAKERLLALNPAIAVDAYAEELTDGNVIGLFSAYDMILDGTDNFAARFLINDAAVKLGRPVVYGAVQGFTGHVSVFGAPGGPCYRCLYPQPPRAQIMNCAEAGVIGALTGMIGTAQAMEAVKLIVGHESFGTLAGRLWTIDARTMETSLLAVPKRGDCGVCARPAAEVVLQYASPVCAACSVVEEIAPGDDIPENAVFIDVRERDEWDAGHIGNARHLPLSALQKNPELFAPPPKGTCCVLYCQKGGRSRKAAEILMQAGFTGLVSLKGGYEAWRAFAE
jgi:adenylyltransferase/sulfurtransferase